MLETKSLEWSVTEKCYSFTLKRRDICATRKNEWEVHVYLESLASAFGESNFIFNNYLECIKESNLIIKKKYN